MATLTTIERLLDEIDRLADEDHVREIKEIIARARGEISDGNTLVTTTQAAKLLGVGSINTIKSMVRHGEIVDIRKAGNRTMIPLREIKRLQGTDVVRDLRSIADALTLGALPGETSESTQMLQQEMDILEVGRPGTPPWKK